MISDSGLLCIFVNNIRFPVRKWMLLFNIVPILVGLQIFDD